MSTQPVDSDGRPEPIDRARTGGVGVTVDQAQWYRDTGHCGGCGQPGVFCLCTDRTPCGCRDLHEMGSGRVEGALDQFADAPPVTVVADQSELF